MLTGRENRDVDMEAMLAGAVDYLVKGQIEPEDLSALYDMHLIVRNPNGRSG